MNERKSKYKHNSSILYVNDAANVRAAAASVVQSNLRGRGTAVDAGLRRHERHVVPDWLKSGVER